MYNSPLPRLARPFCPRALGIFSVMLSEQPVLPPDPIATPPNEPIEPLRDKIRLRFAKVGDLRFLSHHDLLRTFDRLLRRTALPVRQTQGFNPKARLIFALSLPLGVVGREEVAELEFTEQLPIEEIEGRLRSQCPPGLQLLSVRRISPKASAQVRSFCYRLRVPNDRAETARVRLTEVLARTECTVERTKPTARRVDVRPFLRDLRLAREPKQESDALAATNPEEEVASFPGNRPVVDTDRHGTSRRSFGAARSGRFTGSRDRSRTLPA